ncbi:MAG: DUF6352 family protein [Hyphomicrobiaceae bacterium]
MMREFWKSAGLHLVTHRADGWLAPTPDYVRAYLTRPEVHPIDTSCAREIALHEALIEEPALAVSEETLGALADPDAADNYRAVLGFRDLLLEAGTLEEAYLRIARSGRIALPPVFLDQLVHLILRNALSGTTDPMRLRAAEIFFRAQTASTDGGRVMLADEEIVEMRSAKVQETGLAQLLASTGTPLRQVSLDVLSQENAGIYWDRSDRFDTVIDFRFGQPAPDAFARVLEIWLQHLLGLETRITAVGEIKDKNWRWHIGLDREANAILNALYEGQDPGLDARARIVGLFRMQIRDDSRVLDRVRGAPVYLGLAMSPAKRVLMKPQNLIANLPLRVAT